MRSGKNEYGYLGTPDWKWWELNVYRAKIQGTLDVSGASDLNGTLDVSGASDLNGALDVAGATTLKATTVGGDLLVNVNSTTQGRLIVDSGSGSNVYLSSGRNEYGNIGSNGNRWWEIHVYKAYSTAFSTYSDSRLKENIRFLNSEETLEKLLTLRGVQYDAKEGTPLFTKSENASPGDNENILGVIAQEVEKVFPGILGSESGGYRTVQYD